MEARYQTLRKHRTAQRLYKQITQIVIVILFKEKTQKDDKARSHDCSLLNLNEVTRTRTLRDSQLPNISQKMRISKQLQIVSLWPMAMACCFKTNLHDKMCAPCTVVHWEKGKFRPSRYVAESSKTNNALQNQKIELAPVYTYHLAQKEVRKNNR